jgi:hypothetical protein
MYTIYIYDKKLVPKSEQKPFMHLSLDDHEDFGETIKNLTKNGYKVSVRHSSGTVAEQKELFAWADKEYKDKGESNNG